MPWQVRDEIVDDVMAFVQQHIKSPNWRYREVHSVLVRNRAQSCTRTRRAWHMPCHVAARAYACLRRCCAQAATHAFGQILEGPSQERLSVLVEQVRAYENSAVPSSTRHCGLCCSHVICSMSVAPPLVCCACASLAACAAHRSE